MHNGHPAAVGYIGAATAVASVQVRDAERDADLILLAAERRQGGPIVSDLAPDDGIRPRADVQRRGGATELVGRVRRETHGPTRPRALLLVHIVAPHRNADRPLDCAPHPAAHPPPPA